MDYSLEDLPEEVTYNIMNYMDYPSLGRIGQTSSSQRRISSDILRKKQERDDINSFYSGTFIMEIWKNPNTGAGAILDDIRRPGYVNEYTGEKYEGIGIITIDVSSSQVNIPTFNARDSILQIIGVPLSSYPEIYGYLRDLGFKLVERR